MPHGTTAVEGSVRSFQRRAAIVQERIEWARLAREIREWFSGMACGDPSDLEHWKLWSAWIDGYVARLEADSMTLPEFGPVSTMSP